MDNVSRPLIALLVGTVAFFALWVLALKPSSSKSGGGSPSAYQPAIDKARGAVGTSNAASSAHGGTIVTTTARSTPTTTAPGTQSGTSPNTVAMPATTKPRPSSASVRLGVVSRALKANKVLALLFYNPGAADDQAIKQELQAVPAHGGRVVKLAVPLAELAGYTVVTAQVPVTLSPTLVLVNPQHQASRIVGFADRFEIAQRVADALTLK